MTTIKLPAGMAYVPCDDIALKIADAMYPDDGTDDEGWEIHHGTGWGDAEREIKEAVLSGALPVKKSTTHAPQTFLQGNAWKTGVVTIADLQAYLAERGITLTVADAPELQATTPSHAPVEEASDSPAIPKNKRPDLLTPLIQKAQRDEPDPFSAAVIWPKLCDMAELKTKPFIGKTESGLKWIDANDGFKYLTKEALADRLRRAKRAR